MAFPRDWPAPHVGGYFLDGLLDPCRASLESISAPYFQAIVMSDIFRLSRTYRRDPSIDSWLGDRPNALGLMARQWLECMRGCGDDVREALHDGCPTACVGDAAFAYVNVFKEHVNVGFFRGAQLADRDKLLQGTGKLMRHVKLRPETPLSAGSLTELIHIAYRDMKTRLDGSRP